MKIVFYAHGGSENHGCEAIVRSSAQLLSKLTKRPMLLSYNVKQDETYMLDQMVDLKQAIHPINPRSVQFLKAFFMQKLTGNYHYMDSLAHAEGISKLPKVDAALFIGGDNYCYSDVKNYAYINRMIRKKAKKLILWGASVEPSILHDDKIRKDIQQFDLIVARESISYQALKAINSNTVLLPDPAFFLPACQIDLPKQFIPKKMVGINVSPLILQHETVNGAVMKNYEALVTEILEHTEYSIALIPHVVWQSNDDRKPLELLYEKFRHTGRILTIQDHDCMTQKYIISQCKFFVGARTHATIAAYSTGVPTIVVGYSVKARGIAVDLFGTEQNYVLPAQQLKDAQALVQAFRWLQENEEQIADKLKRKSEEKMALQNEYAKELENALR